MTNTVERPVEAEVQASPAVSEKRVYAEHKKVRSLARHPPGVSVFQNPIYVISFEGLQVFMLNCS